MAALTQNKDLNILKRFISLKKLPSKLHEVVVAYCCYNFINQEEEKQLRELFRFLDHDNKNRLTMNDFIKGFKDANIMIATFELKKIINILDSDGNNSIEYQEFLRAACDKELLFKEENLKAVFAVIDKDKKGYADSDDIKRFVLGEKKIIHRSTIRGSYAQIGMKKNTHLTFEQFCNLIRNNTILEKNSSDSNDSEDDDIFNINTEMNKNSSSSKNIIKEIENNKMYYNMTEGDEIVIGPNKGFHRTKTTKI